jgi:hypothetical protein
VRAVTRSLRFGKETRHPSESIAVTLALNSDRTPSRTSAFSAAVESSGGMLLDTRSDACDSHGLTVAIMPHRTLAASTIKTWYSGLSRLLLL